MILRIVGGLALAVVLALPVAAPARAGSFIEDGFTFGFGFGFQDDGHRHRLFDLDRRAESLHLFRLHRRGFGDPFFGTGLFGHQPTLSARHCRPIEEVAHDRFGNRVLTVATLCFDAFGNAFVVPGSRRIRGYF